MHAWMIRLCLCMPACVYLRAMKHFTYGCLRMANILHCMFHFANQPHHVCAYEICCGFLYFQPISQPLICWLCLKHPGTLKRTSMAADSTPTPIPILHRTNSIRIAYIAGYVEWNANNEKHARLLAWHCFCAVLCGMSAYYANKNHNKRFWLNRLDSNVFVFIFSSDIIVNFQNPNIIETHISFHFYSFSI